MPVLTVYSRAGCHLCEVLIEELLPRVRGIVDVEICDIDSRPDWRASYDIRVPVVELDGEFLCEYQLDWAAVEKAIAKTST